MDTTSPVAIRFIQLTDRVSSLKGKETDLINEINNQIKRRKLLSCSAKEKKEKMDMYGLMAKHPMKCISRSRQSPDSFFYGISGHEYGIQRQNISKIIDHFLSQRRKYELKLENLNLKLESSRQKTINDKYQLAKVRHEMKKANDELATIRNSLFDEGSDSDTDSSSDSE